MKTLWLLFLLAGVAFGSPIQDGDISIEEKEEPIEATGQPLPDLGDQGGLQGDIVDSTDEAEKATDRNALKVGDRRIWPNGKVAWKVAPELSSYTSLIQGVVDEIEQNTCIRFEKLSSYATKDYYLYFFKGRSGCNSPIGRVRMGDASGESGAVTINLDPPSTPTSPSCMHHSVIMHEVFHSLGLAHEHMRYDRDHYLNVKSYNVKPSMLSANFEKVDPQETTTYDVPYDYTSVMHYGATAFSKDGSSKTMVPVDSKYTDIIGNAQTASAGDWIKLNRIYQCGSRYFKTKFNPDEPCINSGDQCLGGSTCSSKKLCKCPSNKPMAYNKKCITGLKNCATSLSSGCNCNGGSYTYNPANRFIKTMTINCNNGGSVTRSCNYETGEYDQPLVCGSNSGGSSGSSGGSKKNCQIPSLSSSCKCTGASIMSRGGLRESITLTCISGGDRTIECNQSTGQWKSSIRC